MGNTTYIPVKAACEVLGLSDRQVRRLIKFGKLNGKYVYINKPVKMLVVEEMDLETFRASRSKS